VAGSASNVVFMIAREVQLTTQIAGRAYRGDVSARLA
jgi:hypothetical protein